MKTKLYNQSAEVIGEVELNPTIFEVAPNEHLVAEAVRAQLANSRKGLAHTKTRGDVSGGGKKPHKQKGTGRARAGSTRGPLWRHGGVAFGPRSERNWEIKINKKAKTKALFMSLSDKAGSGHIIVVDKILLPEAKTKQVASMLSSFAKGIENFGKKQLMLVGKSSDPLALATRNIPRVNTLPAHALNIVDILSVNDVIIPQELLQVIERTFVKTATSVKPESPKKTSDTAKTKPVSKLTSAKKVK